MALSPGTRLGVYEVLAQIGEGGMGLVYRAHDTTLNRDVALKILPDAFANDPDRLARFQREAQVLASLNHPNIAHIHGVEASGGIRALVIELVEGDDLAQRIARGSIPIDEVLPIAQQILEALEAAHEQGIIHRDLKPANIKVRSDGMVKVLDFGLAKAIEGAGEAGRAGRAGSDNLSQSPTITTPAMTHAGMILGTAAYMSPEQAKGRPADRRSDVWAFGCVLYEMLTGRRSFIGEDVAETLAHILTKEPDWTALPAHTPLAVRRLLRRCLERDRKRRLDSAAAARLEIDEASAPPSAADITAISTIDSGQATRSNTRTLPWAITGAALIVTSVLLMLWAPWRATPEPARLTFELQTESGGSPSSFAISPDGTQVVARIQVGDVPRLSIRPLARLEAITLSRTDGATSPFWSPDGRAIGFFADGKLKTVDIVGGGTPQLLAEAGQGLGGSWNRDGVILFAPDLNGPIYRVAAGGGTPVAVTDLDTTRGDLAHRFPCFLSDGVHFLFLVRSPRPEAGGIYLGSLASKETHRLVNAANKPEFAPPDLMLFARESTLMAQQLDVRSWQVLGTPFRVVEPVGSNGLGASSFSVSDTGVLAYRTGSGSNSRELAWVDRSGKQEGVVGVAAGYRDPRLSPDGRQLAVFKADGGGDIWVMELDRGIGTRFTLDPASDNVPVWSPDGTRIAFVSNRDGGVFNIYQKNSGGTGPEELLLKTPHDKLLNDWSPDGRYLVYQEDDPQTKTDLWMLPVVGDRKPSRLLATPFNEGEATFSPDGRWIAYTSDESGTREVYVQKFPTSDRKWHVSNRLAAHPRWGSDGKELFFDSGGTMTAVSITDTGPRGELMPAAPKRLFTGLSDLPPHNFDVAGAGQRFLVLLSPQLTSTGQLPPITVVVNWKSGLPIGR